MDIKTGIIIEGKVYEAIVIDSDVPCDECAFKDKCNGSPSTHYSDLCMDMDYFTNSNGVNNSTIFKEIDLNG